MTVHLKLENMQNTNSFKIRGVANQFCAHQVGTKVVPFVTMSAGRCVIAHLNRQPYFLLFRKLWPSFCICFEKTRPARELCIDA